MKYYITDLREAADTNITDGALAINGASLIDNGFQIPGGSSGNHSELIIKRISPAIDFTAKRHNITATFTVTNFSKLGASLANMLPLLRKYKDGVQVGSDASMTGHNTHTESILSGTKTYIYALDYTLTNSDIINGYYYQIVFRLHRDTAISAGNPVAITFTSLSMTTSLLQEVQVPDKNLKKNYELESNQQFFRIKLDGLVKLFDRDYDYVKDVIDVTFDTEFHFFIFNTVQYFHGTFMATDCEIDEDNKKLEISINSLDEYTDILNGYDKTFDVIKIDPVMETVNIDLRPVLQVYMPRENVLTSIVGDSYWEEDTAKSVYRYQDIYEENKFSLSNEVMIIDLTTYVGTPVNDIRGVYVGSCIGEMFDTSNITYYLYLPGQHAGNYTYRIKINRYQDGNVTFYNAKLYNFSGTMLYYSWADQDFMSRNITGVIDVPERGFNLYEYINAQTDPTVRVVGTVTAKMITTRYALDKEEMAGTATFLRSILADGDIAQENQNYRYVIGALFDVGRISNNLSVEPTRYGKNADGLYYDTPMAVEGINYYPIYRNSWGEKYSLWIRYDYTLYSPTEDYAKTTTNQKYCYPLEGVINSFLKQIAPDITFVDDVLTTETSSYSRFFFDEKNPITGFDNIQYLITPKSNVLHGINSKPAQKAPLTFSSLMNMIKNVFKCYWFVEDGKFRIEHIKFFNGGYAPDTTEPFDLTALKNERSTKSWAFNTSNYKFDKELLPERIEFEYMDNCTEAFSGSPINVISKYVQKGKVDTVNISDFSADIDYMLANKSDISEDGFALLSKDADGKVPYSIGIIKGNKVNLQNGPLSFPFIHNRYYRHDLPASNVLINEVTADVLGILKKKEQEVKFPSDTDPNTNQLIKTYIGNGKIIKMSVNLASRIIEVTLAYDTE